MDPLFDLTGKVALITGGSRGLGYQMVKAFAAHGADIIIASRKLDACEAVAEEVRALGRKALAISAHVGKWAECDRLIDEAYAAFGRVDILVNNAGMGPRTPSHEVTEALFDSVVNLNFKGPFRLASVIAHRMAEGDGGSIINVSSTGGAMPLPAIIPYGSAKAALNSSSHGASSWLMRFFSSCCQQSNSNCARASSCGASRFMSPVMSSISCARAEVNSC